MIPVSAVLFVYILVTLLFISSNASLLKTISEESTDFSALSVPLPPGNQRDDDTPNDDNVSPNNVPTFFSPGYYIQSTFSNAPLSCEGTVVAATVIKFSYQICHIDTVLKYSYKLLLDVSNCRYYQMVRYKDMACVRPLNNVTVPLGSRTCATGKQSSCHFNYNPNTNIVSSYPMLSSVTYNPSGINCKPAVGSNPAGNVIGYDQIVAGVCFYRYGVYEDEVYSYVKAVQTSSSTYGLFAYKSKVNCQYSSNAVDNSPTGSLAVCVTNNKKPQNQYIVQFIQSNPNPTYCSGRRLLDAEVEAEKSELSNQNKQLEADPVVYIPSVSPTARPSNPSMAPAYNYQTLLKANGIVYTAGYYMSRVYSNAPLSCEGNVVQEVVEKFGYHICYIDQLNPTTSFYLLLDVANCWRYMKVSYGGLGCMGNVLSEISYNLTMSNKSSICYRGSSGTCSFLFPPTNIPSSSNMITTQNYPKLSPDSLLTPICKGANSSVYWRTTNNLCVYSVQNNRVTPFIVSGPWMKTYSTYPSGYFIGFYSSKLNCQSSSDSQYTRSGVLNTCLTYSTNAPITKTITNYFIASYVPASCGSNNDDDSNLTDGAIAGIVIAVFVFVILVACVALLCFQFCSRRPSASSETKMPSSSGGVTDSTALI